MFTQRDVWLAQERAQEMRADAQRRGRIRELLGHRYNNAPIYASLLDHIGHVLIETGLNLRARYGTLDAYTEAAPSLEPSGQHG